MVKIASRLHPQIMALVVRLLLIIHTLLAYWLVTKALRNLHFWYMMFLVVPQLAEYLLTAIYRNGYEGSWFCPCFFFYLLSTVPAIWLLELDRLARYTEIYANNNSSQSESLSTIQGVSLPITLSPSLWMSVIEQSFLFLIIMGRWILPRGELSRDKLSQLLFVYIGMASDIMDLFVLFEEPEVRKDKTYTYVILVLWSISLLQFSIVMTATRSPKRSRAVLVHPEEGGDVAEERTRGCSSCCGCLKTEIWSLLISFLMQDGPFLTCRLYGLVRYNLITYSIIFYTCKNIFVVLLLIYRVFILCCLETSEPEKATQRAVKKVSAIRNLSRSSRSRISTVEEEYTNTGPRYGRPGTSPKKVYSSGAPSEAKAKFHPGTKPRSGTPTETTPKHSPVSIVDIN